MPRLICCFYYYRILTIKRGIGENSLLQQPVFFSVFRHFRYENEVILKFL